ncbi:MAG: helix-turn-helix transcriptional regulator [Flavobacteriaceae bacterium]
MGKIKSDINILDLPAVIMVMESSNYLNRLEAKQFSIFTQKFHYSVSKTLTHFEGYILNQDNCKYLVSFESATNAVLCALQLEQKFKYVTPKFDEGNRKLQIGLSAVDTTDQKAGNIDIAIAQATQMCEVVKDTLVISAMVKMRYEKENKNARIDAEHIRTLKSRELEFLNQLMKASQRFSRYGSSGLEQLRATLGYSRSTFYRYIKKLTGKSPHLFIREFRLKRALQLLHDRRGNISKIASETGFKNASHFARCFNETFGILPSRYARQVAV